VAEHLDHPAIELDHDRAEDDFVHARNYPGPRAEPARRLTLHLRKMKRRPLHSA
jgi:hypothetical protein